jgi:hypothetical protein
MSCKDKKEIGATFPDEGIVAALRRQLSRKYSISSVRREETSKIKGAVSLQSTKLLLGVWQMLYAKLEKKYMRAFSVAWLDSSIVQQLAALITSLSTIEEVEKEPHKYGYGGTVQ